VQQQELTGPGYLSDPDLVRHVGRSCRPTAKPRLESAKKRCSRLCADKAGAFARKVHKHNQRPRLSRFRRQSPTLLRLHRIYSLRTGVATGGGIHESSASLRSSFAWMKPRIPSGQSFEYQCGRMPGGNRNIRSILARKWRSGLWVPNGKIWVKGFALSGIVTRGGPANGVRIVSVEWRRRSAKACANFVKFVQEATRFPKAKAHT